MSFESFASHEDIYCEHTTEPHKSVIKKGELTGEGFSFFLSSMILVWE